MTEATVLALVAIVGTVITTQRNRHLGEQNENITKMIITHAEDSKKMVAAVKQINKKGSL